MLLVTAVVSYTLYNSTWLGFKSFCLMKWTLIVKEECLMMRMLEEMTGFDFFWHHHVSNFRGATLDNGEENNYCSSLTSNQNTSVQLFHADL